MNQGFAVEKEVFESWHKHFPNPRTAVYERRARGEFSLLSGVSVSDQKIKSELRQTPLIVMGDDRLNPCHQREVMRLLHSLRSSSPRVLLTDRFPRSSQKNFQSYVRGDRTLNALLSSLGVELGNQNSPEGGLRNLFAWLKQKRVRVRVVESHRHSLLDRDRSLAMEAGRLVKRGMSVILWVGSLRLAPGHLLRQLDQRGMPYRALVLGVPEIRWNTQTSNGWMKVRPSVYVHVGHSPLLSLEYRRAWENRVLALVDSGDTESFFFASLRGIAKKVGQHGRKPQVKLYHPFNPERLAHLGRQRNRSQAGKFLFSRLLDHESAVIPESEEVLLSTLERGHIAEEAAHYLRLRGKRTRHFGLIRTQLEETFGFLASRWIDSNRPIPDVRGPSVGAWEEVHQEGYALGDQLHAAWSRSKKARDKIRQAWNHDPISEGDARRLWMDLKNIR